MIELVDVRLDHPRGGQPLVSEGNLKVERGEITLVVGAAGVGTSRLVAAALGEVSTAAGRISVLGHDVAKLRRSSLRMLRRRVGIVPQDLCLLEDRSAQINVALPLEIDGVPRSITILRASAILAKLGLESEASLPVDCLSASAKQRVAVARALVREPEVVIADHPTMWQDAEGAELVCSALADAAAAGACVLVFGRDHALRAIAERDKWQQLSLIEGQIRPLAAGIEIEGLDVPESIPNLVPFPLSARTAGVA